ncbi:MAG: inositol monophosphatase [Parachlamydiaceae bacterium]|nr:inositol monophosphatase [Parachlamydiaceae bacterium]
MLKTHNSSYFSFVAVQAALKAGDILRKGFGEIHQIIAKPGRQNIVTEMDKASEACIIDFIKSHFPTHSILAEESGSTGDITDNIVWIIDPLDGTTNFARHIPLFTISIAAYYREEGLCGVIYHPITNELFVAEKGKGAYLNGNKLSVSKISNLDEALIGGGFPNNIAENPIPYLNHFAKFTKLGVAVRHLGSAALALAYVAAGKLDGFWLDHLYPWDLAAGKLLVEEAGGKVTRYSGNPHQLHVPSDILASNQFIHQDMLNQIIDKTTV